MLQEDWHGNFYWNFFSVLKFIEYVQLESVNLFLHIFLCLKVILTMKTLHKVTQNLHLKTHNILERHLAL